MFLSAFTTSGRYIAVLELSRDDPDGLQTLLHMESEIYRIKEEARLLVEAHKAAERLFSGDLNWYETINRASVHDVQRQRMERQVFALAFQKLTNKETA